MRHKALVVALAVVTISVLATARAQDRTSQLEGWKPYTPSRLEWFAVDLNASDRTQLTEDNGYLLNFIPSEKTDTIIIYVRYMRTVNREAMNLSIDAAREVIKINAKSKGWDGWLKVRENIKMANN